MARLCVSTSSRREPVCFSAPVNWRRVPCRENHWAASATMPADSGWNAGAAVPAVPVEVAGEAVGRSAAGVAPVPEREEWLLSEELAAENPAVGGVPVVAARLEAARL